MKQLNVSDLQHRNRREVLRQIAMHDGITKPELSRLTGISAPTVMKIADFLTEQHLIIEVGVKSDTVGRKPAVLKLDPVSRFFVGVIIEGSHVIAGIVDPTGRIHFKRRQELGSDTAEGLAVQISALINSLVDDSAIPRIRMCGIGIGYPAVYDCEAHRASYILFSDTVKEIDLNDFEHRLEEACGMHVTADNDANVAVFGEYHERGLNEADLAFLSLGTGFGAGVMLNGELRRGSRYSCGEISFLCFSEKYSSSSSHGWLEDRIGLHALREKFGFDPVRPEACDRAAVIEYLAPYLALTVCNLSCTFDLPLICLGGVTVTALGDDLVGAVRRRLAKISSIPVTVERSVCSDAGILGAAHFSVHKEIDRLICL